MGTVTRVRELWPVVANGDAYDDAAAQEFISALSSQDGERRCAATAAELLASGTDVIVTLRTIGKLCARVLAQRVGEDDDDAAVALVRLARLVVGHCDAQQLLGSRCAFAELCGCAPRLPLLALLELFSGLNTFCEILQRKNENRDLGTCELDDEALIFARLIASAATSPALVLLVSRFFARQLLQWDALAGSTSCLAVLQVLLDR